MLLHKLNNRRDNTLSDLVMMLRREEQFFVFGEDQEGLFQQKRGHLSGPAHRQVGTLQALVAKFCFFAVEAVNVFGQPTALRIKIIYS